MFKSLECLPKDPTFALFDKFKADNRADKINLGIGLYFDEGGNTFVFDAVKKAVRDLDLNNFNYQPIGGDRDFLCRAGEFIFGESFDEGHLAMQATCGGTQACRCFSDLSMKVLHTPEIQVGVPTWVNYYALFGQMKVSEFEHLDENGRVNVKAHLDAAKQAPEGSAFLLQGASAHNPSGMNLGIDDLKNLIDVLEEKKMILFMDMAYFGFGEEIEKDREYVKLCFKNLERFAIGVSFSKNASLYEHRCGALYVKTVNGECTESQLQQSIRETISVPPGFGQEVMVKVLRDYRNQWESELNAARESINARRERLLNLLCLERHEFEVVKESKGMFGLLPLDEGEVIRLRDDHGIYLLSNGRINFAGMKEADIERIAKGILAVKR